MRKSLFTIAFDIAKKAHEGQKRKFGADKGLDYIVHPTRVASNLKGKVKVAAILHDTIEDTYVTKQFLLDNGIPQDIADAVEILSKTEGEGYYDFIMRICYDDFSLVLPVKNQIALVVKMEDIKDNLSSLENGSLKDKYLLALHILEWRFDELVQMGEIFDGIFKL